MIKLSDLLFREYIGKDCCAFQYKLTLGDEVKPILIQFEREIDFDENPTKRWKMSTILNNEKTFTHCHVIYFEMPVNNMPLEVVCASGLMQLKFYLFDCQEYFSYVLSGLTCTLEGMV